MTHGIIPSKFPKSVFVPIHRSFEWSIFKVSVYPLGLRRYIFYPYFNGSDLRIKFNIKTKSDEPANFRYHWDFNYVQDPSNSINIGTGGNELTDRPLSSATEQINIPFLSYSGHHILFLKIDYPTNGKTFTIKRIVDIYTQERDTFKIMVFLVVLPLLVGIIGWLVGKFM